MKEIERPETEIARSMRALGHPVRLEILSILSEKCDVQCFCTDVTQCLPLAQSTVSQHIKVLLEAGLIKRHAKGTRNCYTINFERLDALHKAYGAYLAGLSRHQDAALTCAASLPESV